MTESLSPLSKEKTKWIQELVAINAILKLQFVLVQNIDFVMWFCTDNILHLNR